MSVDERIAAVAGKLSRLKARHNDLAEEISELQDELAGLRRKKTPAKTDPPKRRTASGHADEDDPDDGDPDDDDPDDDDPDDDDPDDEPEERPAKGRRR